MLRGSKEPLFHRIRNIRVEQFRHTAHCFSQRHLRDTTPSGNWIVNDDSQPPSLLLLLHISPRRLGLLNNLFLQLPRDNIVVVHLHVEAATALCHRG